MNIEVTENGKTRKLRLEEQAISESMGKMLADSGFEPRQWFGYGPRGAAALVTRHAKTGRYLAHYV